MGKPESDQTVSNGDETDVNQSVAKAFDTLAKAIQPQSADNNKVWYYNFICILLLFLLLLVTIQN